MRKQTLTGVVGGVSACLLTVHLLQVFCCPDGQVPQQQLQDEGVELRRHANAGGHAAARSMAQCRAVVRTH